MGSETSADAAVLLASNGIAVCPPWAPDMVVFNENHPAIERMFAETRWADGLWRDSLMSIEGARRLEKPRRLGGVDGPQIAVPVTQALETLRAQGFSLRVPLDAR